MSFPFQISDAELKRKNKGAEDSEDSSEDEQAQQSNNESQEPPCPPEKPPEKQEPCEPDFDFCGVFDRAMQPFMPQPPAVNINIVLNLGGDPCQQQPQQEEPKRQPQVTSFLKSRNENDNA